METQTLPIEAAIPKPEQMQQALTAKQLQAKRTEKKYLSFLIHIYNLSNGEKSCNPYIETRAMSISAQIPSIMVKHKLLIFSNRVTGVGRLYKWNTIPPNIYMAKRIADELREEARERANKNTPDATPRQEESNGAIILNPTPEPKVRGTYRKREKVGLIRRTIRVIGNLFVNTKRKIW